MALPFFYAAEPEPGQQLITLDEDNSRHVIQVLRMKTGEQLNLTNGRGQLFQCEITAEHKKHCVVKVISTTSFNPPAPAITIGISLLKNPARFEWFLEKATEIGVRTIVPLLCRRTEKEKFRHDRLTGILVSAMLQSQQTWLPVLHQPVAFDLLFRQEDIAAIPRKYIAHCIDGEKSTLQRGKDDAIALIGPEGDFTNEEIELAIAHQYQPATLGSTRLRAETAGMVAAVQLVIGGA